MAQYDVYRNHDSGTQGNYPLLLDVQHEVLSDLSTRIVIPLSRLNSLSSLTIKVLTPSIHFDDDRFILMTPQISAVSVGLLRDPVGTLEHCRDDIIAALDLALVGF